MNTTINPRQLKNIIIHLFSKSKKYLLVLPVLAILFFLFYNLILKDLPSASAIGLKTYPQSSKIYDRNGKLLYTIYTSKNQTFVPLNQIPKELKNATIAIEDKNFYKHGAIDIRGITRALYFTLFKKQVQGGSTITQQLVKNSILTSERTITRKVKEIFLSFFVEALYSKDKILEMYLNQVSYGGTAWGVQSASLVYFDKPVSRLNLAESAFIAALPEAPSLYSPFGSHPEEGKKRQIEVLKRMKEQGYITKAQEEKAKNYPLIFSKFRDRIEAPHFVFYVKDLLVEKYGQKMVEQGGLNITTSLDLSLQHFAQNTIASEVAKLEEYNVSNAAALITDPKTGEILAMIGSKDYFSENIDGNVNIVLSKRQPGSSIKPINYATGLIKGYTAATPFIDKKTCFPNPGKTPYCPVNYDGKFHGVVQMRFALGNSFNIPAVKMLKANGLEAMIATAEAMGIKSFKEPQRYGLSLTLGGGEVTMIEMGQAFGVFANLGYKTDLHPILKVEDSYGKILEEYKPPKSFIFGEKVIPEGVAFIISHILQDNGARLTEFGGNSPLKIKDYPVAVKTGTTNDFRDNWTIGYTPSYVVGVWVGNNNNEPMQGLVSGITGAAPIWHKLMAHLIQENPPEPLQKPDNVYGKTICSTSGLLPPPEGTPDRCPTRFEYFIKGTEPTKIDPGRQKTFIDKATGDIAKKTQTDNIEEKNELIITDPTGDSYCLTCPHPEPSPTP
ncbi:PBP1A family penicillin-binding protein [Candidatus Parcubacteria bacterium]|nr:MAG: PBP1A family penicillin-binding protein [Candidatus Parcubacteria bacterium]